MVGTLTLTGARALPRGRLALIASLGLAGMFLPLAGRPLALVTPLALAGAVVLAVGLRGAGGGSSLVATLVGLLPALVVTGAFHDLLGLSPDIALSALALLVVWVGTASTLGLEVADRVSGPRARADVWFRVVAAASVTTFIGAALGRLLLADRGPADRLVWAIWEEDNAQIVGIGREVLTGGPRGAELADQYGTAFVNLPLLIMRLLGGSLPSDVDPRIEAITIFTVSTIVVIGLAGLAMALIAALPHHVHARSGGPRIGTLTIATGSVATAVATIIAFSLLVVLPMRTGFLTFVWGLTLVLSGAAIVAVTPSDAGRPARIVFVAHLLGVAVLLLSSWPFIAPALAPLAIVPLLWLRWGDVRVSVRRHRARWSIGLLVGIVLLGLVGYWFSRWGPAAEVLSYGLDILLIGASGIEADRPARLAAMFGMFALGALTIVAVRSGARLHLSVGLLGPVLGGGALYLTLKGAAALLTDGVLNYSGIKLFYGVVTLAMTLGLLALVSLMTRWGVGGAMVALAAVILTHQLSATASLHTEWWDRTDLGPHPHVTATIDAIERTSIDVPIRCLPSPGTVVTGTARWAAYTCARWMEDAFNEGRFDGHRFDLLDAEGSTFEATVEHILERSPSEYLFAHRFTMGPGWFGWAGPGS